MKYEEYPVFENDEDLDDWYDRVNAHYIDHKPFRVLESVDSMLSYYGLQVIIYGDDLDAPFSIGKISLP